MTAAKPKPDYRQLKPHPDDFAAWCEQDVTRWVAMVWEQAAQKVRDQWLAATWPGGPDIPQLDQQQYAIARTRADAYMAFLETGLDDYARIIEGDASAVQGGQPGKPGRRAARPGAKPG